MCVCVPRFHPPRHSAQVCGRALAIGSLEKEDIDRGEDVDDLSDSQLQEYIDRVEFYREKYTVVGKMMAEEAVERRKTGAGRQAEAGGEEVAR